MLKVLLVDDNPGDQRLFKDTIHEAGIECSLLTASNGNDAIELVKTEKPGLIVLDVMMPGLSGYEVCNSLKFSSSNEKGIPIIMLTGRNEELDPRIGKMLKVYYMQKPCKTQELKSMLEEIFKGEAC